MEAVTSVKSEVVKLENRYHDEPMDVGEFQSEGGDNEEGEVFSSDDEVVNTNVQSSVVRKNTDNVFGRNTDYDGFVIGGEVFDEKEDLKKIARAKRFALPSTQSITKTDLSNLYKSLGIDKENERHYRFNAIHMRGTQDMSTDDVFQYFESYGPTDIEWINDVSCNVLWRDDVSAAKALLCLSKEIKNLEKVHLNADPFEKDLKDGDDASNNEEASDAVDARDIKVAIPPGYWRLGVSTPKSNAILLRLATRSDKKQKFAESSSEYYKKYGNPHFGNVPGILSKTRRSILLKHKRRKQMNSHLSDSDGEEPELDDKKNPWGNLAQNWKKIEDEEDEIKSRDLKNRLTLKRAYMSNMPDLRKSLNDKHRQKVEDEESNLNTSEDERQWESKSKIPRMKMYADDEEEKKEKSLERRLKSDRLGLSRPKSTSNITDLRNKISGKKVNDPKSVLKGARSHDWTKPNDEGLSVSNSDEDRESGDWALEHYNDLRESLRQSKKSKQRSRTSKFHIEDSEEDDLYGKDMNCRSPLQIEIDNDEYYQGKSESETSSSESETDSDSD